MSGGRLGSEKELHLDRTHSWVRRRRSCGVVRRDLLSLSERRRVQSGTKVKESRKRTKQRRSRETPSSECEQLVAKFNEGGPPLQLQQASRAVTESQACGAHLASRREPVEREPTSVRSRSAFSAQQGKPRGTHVRRSSRLGVLALALCASRDLGHHALDVAAASPPAGTNSRLSTLSREVEAWSSSPGLLVASAKR